jgi:hypothetical protein
MLDALDELPPGGRQRVHSRQAGVRQRAAMLVAALLVHASEGESPAACHAPRGCLVLRATRCAARQGPGATPMRASPTHIAAAAAALPPAQLRYFAGGLDATVLATVTGLPSVHRTNYGNHPVPGELEAAATATPSDYGSRACQRRAAPAARQPGAACHARALNLRGCRTRLHSLTSRAFLLATAVRRCLAYCGGMPGCDAASFCNDRGGCSLGTSRVAVGGCFLLATRGAAAPVASGSGGNMTSAAVVGPLLPPSCAGLPREACTACAAVKDPAGCVRCVHDMFNAPPGALNRSRTAQIPTGVATVVASPGAQLPRPESMGCARCYNGSAAPRACADECVLPGPRAAQCGPCVFGWSYMEGELQLAPGTPDECIACTKRFGHLWSLPCW